MQPKSSKKFSDPDTQVLHLMKDPDDKENLLQNIPWHTAINYPVRRGSCWSSESATLRGHVGII